MSVAEIESPKAQWLKSERVAKREQAVNEMALHIRSFKLPEPDREHMFAKEIGRKWRFDFCWHPYKIALEVEGLVVKRVAGQVIVSGRHATVTGYSEDRIKYANAAILGWVVLSFNQSLIKDGTAIDLLDRMLRVKGWRPGDSKLTPK